MLIFFNSIEFDGIRKQAGLNSFSLTPKRWINATGAIGIIAKTGRYGGTFAHKDIDLNIPLITMDKKVLRNFSGLAFSIFQS